MPPRKSPPQTPSIAVSALQTASLVVEFGQRLNQLLDKSGYPTATKARYTRLSMEYTVSTQTVRKWLHGRALPNPTILVRLSGDLGVSIDWMLTGVAPATSADLVRIPMYRMSEGSCANIAGCFEHFSNYYRDRDSTLRPEHEYRVLVLNWSDADDPPIALGDVFLVDTTTAALRENGVYLLRSAALTSVRRIRVSLDGNAIVSRVTVTGDREELTIPIAALSFNGSDDLNAIAKGELMVLGRIIAVQRMLDRRHRDFS